MRDQLSSHCSVLSCTVPPSSVGLISSSEQELINPTKARATTTNNNFFITT